MREQADCLYDTGVVLGRAGRPEEALSAYEDAAALYSSLPDTQRQQAMCLHRAGGALAEAGRFEEALTAFQDAVDLYPDLRETGQDEDDDAHTAWSAQCFAEDGDCSRRFQMRL